MRSFPRWKSVIPALILATAWPVSWTCAATILLGNYKPVLDVDPVKVIESNPAAPAPAPGSYTFVLSNANAADDTGAGFGSLLVDSKGNVRIAGTLSNGKTFSAGGQSSVEGKYDIVAKIKNDVLSGSIEFIRTEDADISATLNYCKSARGGAQESNETIILTGSSYSSLYNAPLVKFTIDPAGRPSIQHTASLTARGAYIITGQGADLASLTVSKKNGLLAGKFKSAGKWKNLRGVVLQSSQSAQGFVQGGGSFDLVAVSASASNSSGAVKTSSGTLVLSGSNSYTGGSIINSSIVQVGGSNPVTDATLQLNNGLQNVIAEEVYGFGYSAETFNPGIAGTLSTNSSGVVTTNLETFQIISANTYTTISGRLMPTGTLDLASGGTLSLIINRGATIFDVEGNEITAGALLEGDIVTLHNVAYRTFIIGQNVLLVPVPLLATGDQ